MRRAHFEVGDRHHGAMRKCGAAAPVFREGACGAAARKVTMTIIARWWSGTRRNDRMFLTMLDRNCGARVGIGIPIRLHDESAPAASEKPLWTSWYFDFADTAAGLGGWIPPRAVPERGPRVGQASCVQARVCRRWPSTTFTPCCRRTGSGAHRQDRPGPAGAGASEVLPGERRPDGPGGTTTRRRPSPGGARPVGGGVRWTSSGHRRWSRHQYQLVTRLVIPDRRRSRRHRQRVTRSPSRRSGRTTLGCPDWWAWTGCGSRRTSTTEPI